MSSPLSFGDLITIVQEAVKLYQRIKDVPKVLEEIGNEMKSLGLYLSGVEKLLHNKVNAELAALHPELTQETKRIVKQIREKVLDIIEIFKDYCSMKGPRMMKDVWFGVTNRNDKLMSIRDGIDRAEFRLERILQLMGLHGTYAVYSQVRALGNPRALPRQGGQLPSGRFSILFVDPLNIGRSRVAEAYASLMKEGAINIGEKWPIGTVDSAGFFVKNGSDCAQELKNLNLRWPQEFRWGNWPPSEVPMAALFDNKSHDHPYKDKIKKAIFTRGSKGIKKDIFSKFDYILVFTRRELINLLAMKTAFTSLSENAVGPDEKGKVIHLGQYLTLGKTVEILDAKKDKDGNFSRENWNRTVAQIKTAFKGFLKEELGWTKPPLSQSGAK
jgi:protein-tyrosine-phosphatase